MRRLVRFPLCFILFFLILEKTGLFTDHPLPVYEILLTPPVLAASLLVPLGLVADGWRRRRVLARLHWLITLAVVLVVTGLYTSRLTRFHADVVVTEDQELEGRAEEFQQGHIRMGRLAHIPSIGLKLDKVTPELSRGGTKLAGIRASFRVFPTKEHPETKLEVGDILPRYFHGMLIRVADYGFAPRYSFRAVNGSELDSAWVYLKTFPAGTEDSFRLLTPHTFYVRYYPPDGTDRDGHFGLRVSRNKDILFNGSARLHERIPVDNASISFEEIHHWTRVTITRDPGLAVIAAGGLIFLLALIDLGRNNLRRNGRRLRH